MSYYAVFLVPDRSGGQGFRLFVILKVLPSLHGQRSSNLWERGKVRVRVCFLQWHDPSYTQVFQSHPIGQNLVTWPCLVVKEARKYSLQLGKKRRINIGEMINSLCQSKLVMELKVEGEKCI